VFMSPKISSTHDIGGFASPVRAARFATLIALASLVCFFAVAGRSAAAQAFNFPQQAKVGSTTSPVSINVAIQHSGKLNAIKVLGQGNSGVDFISANSGTCSLGVSYPAGQTCTVGVSFAPLFPGLRSGAVVLLASDGSVLGTQFLSGTGLGALGTFVPGTMSTVAGHATWLYNGDGELATNASLYLPFGILVDSGGNLYIADSANNRVRKVTPSTGFISTIAGDGILGDSGDGGSALQASLSGPSSVAIDGAGNIYVCDNGNSAVRKVAATTGIITTVAGTLGRLGYTGDGGPATGATLNSPNGIALDLSGNLYIADTANNAIRRVDAVTGIITTVAGVGSAGFNGDGIAASAAKLNQPWSVTPAAGGVLYIADQGNNRIRMVDATGSISTVAGTGNGSFSGDTGPASQATLDAPANVAIDVAGNLYIADSGNNRIRKVSYAGGIISTIAGLNSQSLSGDGGPATSAGLYGPYTLALDGLGNLYIADVFHNRIRKVIANTAVLDFQPMRIGRVAASQPQTLENDGNATLNVSSVQAVSDSVIDGTTTTCLSDLALAPLGACVIGAAFAPTHLGTPDTGSIALNSDAVNSPDTLQLSGNVLSEDPSSVSLSSSANPIDAGGMVTFSVTASSDGAIPTGQVTLLDGTNAIGTTNLLTGGNATFAISTLTGGQHSITASYSGDNNNTSGVSAPLIEVVKFLTAPTQTTLAANANPALAGAPATLTATIALTTPGSGNGSITGPVSFTDGSAVLGAGSVTGGTAGITLSTLAVGPHSIVATYSGTSSFAASSSAPLNLTVQPGTTGTTLTSSANPSFGGATLVLTAAVAGNGTMPTGNVTFLDGTTPLGATLLNQAGIATLPVSGLALGAHTIVAIYSGDMLNNGSASSALLQTVNIASTTGVVTSSINPAPQGSPVVLTATFTGNGGIPTGAVQFLDGTVPLGTGTLDSTGATTYTAAMLSLGSHSITVSYQGDALDNGSTSTPLVQVIVPATTTVAFVSSANPSPFGSPLSFSVLVRGTGSQPVGSITLMDGPATLGVQPLDATGLANFSTPNLPIGVHNLVALYSGDADHPQNNATLAERVVQVTATSLMSSSLNGIAGTTVTLTSVVTGLDNQPVTGTIVFKDGPAAIATVAIDATGAAVFSSSSFAIGKHSISALYSGDTLNQASSSGVLPQTIQIATTATTLTSSANPGFTGASIALSASVSGNGGSPTGSITFRDGTATLGSIPVSTSGAASLSTSTLTPGIHSITATYNGDANDSPSVAPGLSQQIVQQTSLSISSSANPSMFKDSVTVTVAVSGGLSAYPATGAVTLTDGPTTVGTATLNSAGTVAFTLTAPVLGPHTLQATYAGDTRNSPATSPAFTQSVILRPTTASLAASNTILPAGQQVTFVSVIQGIGPNIPTGVVTFASGATVLGTAKLDATGVAILSFEPPQAIDTVVAQYPGDTLFAASNSTPLTVSVGPTIEFTLTATPAAVTVQSGAHTTLQVAIVSASAFTDTVVLGCAGLPASSTCTFSQDQIKVSGGTSQTFSVVLDTGTPLGAGPTASLAPARTGMTLAGMLPCGLLALLFIRPKRFRKQLSILPTLLILGTIGMLSGCASSFTVNDTPPGTYAIQIIGKGAISGATQSGTVSLTVTP
jgi:hypothetical protein